MTTEDLRRALEALRNGVPNRDAVRVLGCGQTVVIDRFRTQLDEAPVAGQQGRQAAGMVVAGGFGSGKSHLLEHLRHLALEANFVCSLVAVSKETPLYDPAKLYAAAVAAAVVPGVTGHAVHEVALRLRPDAASYSQFFLALNREDNALSRIFPATLLLHERLMHDPEMLEKVRGFWAGERLSLADVRGGLRQIGQAAAYPLRSVPLKQLALQRFAFAAGLAKAAGYSGWVLLIDEVELIGRYSRLQRAGSYSELARWLGRVEAEQFPGITTVAAITNDFALAVLQGKGDLEYVVPQLESRNTDQHRSLAGRAATGMRIIERETVALAPPDVAVLDQTCEALRGIHARAYGWDPPPARSVAPTALHRAMRSYVRRWINEWDLQRLYPGEAIETVETELTIDYLESPDLEAPQDGAQDEPAARG